MRKLTKVGIATLGAASFALPVTPAHADYAPHPQDVNGVGSDTVQNVMNFVSDSRQGWTDGGGTHAAAAGWNGTAPKYRIVNFDATPDENDRAGFANGSTAAAPIKLNPTIILREGANPTHRPNGSTEGMAALDQDSSQSINYVRTSRVPKAAEIATASNPGLAAASDGHVTHSVRLSKDGLQMAVTSAVSGSPASNAPAAGLSIAELQAIYSCNTTATVPGVTGQTNLKWSDLPGNSGGSATTIVLEVPQTGSGTRDTFLTDVFGSKSYLPPSGCNWLLTEENDPTALTPTTAGGSTNSYGNVADELSPFSSGRKALFDSGYFHTPANTNNAMTSNISLLATGGNAGDGNAEYLDNRGLFITFRQSDALSTTPWQPGDLKNWAQDLFIPGNIANPTVTGIKPFVNAVGISAINAAGVTAAYADCGADFSDASPASNPCNL